MLSWSEERGVTFSVSVHVMRVLEEVETVGRFAAAWKSPRPGAALSRGDTLRLAAIATGWQAASPWRQVVESCASGVSGGRVPVGCG